MTRIIFVGAIVIAMLLVNLSCTHKGMFWKKPQRDHDELEFKLVNASTPLFLFDMATYYDVPFIATDYLSGRVTVTGSGKSPDDIISAVASKQDGICIRIEDLIVCGSKAGLKRLSPFAEQKVKISVETMPSGVVGAVSPTKAPDTLIVKDLATEAGVTVCLPDIPVFGSVLADKPRSGRVLFALALLLQDDGSEPPIRCGTPWKPRGRTFHPVCPEFKYREEEWALRGIVYNAARPSKSFIYYVYLPNEDLSRRDPTTCGPIWTRYTVGDTFGSPYNSHVPPEIKSIAHDHFILQTSDELIRIGFPDELQ